MIIAEVAAGDMDIFGKFADSDHSGKLIANSRIPSGYIWICYVVSTDSRSGSAGMTEKFSTHLHVTRGLSNMLCVGSYNDLTMAKSAPPKAGIHILHFRR